MDKITKHCRELKEALLADPKRNGSGWRCEGQTFIHHICFGGPEMNEVIIPRAVFQKIPRAKQIVFYHEINCAICCQTFHTKHGHTRAYREWHEARMIEIYGEAAVDAWKASLPLKFKFR